MKKYAIILLSLITALILAQCSKRSNPVDTTTQHGRYWTLFFESNAIAGDIMNDYWFRQILVYTPPGYDPGDTTRGVATDSIFIPQETTFVDTGGVIDTIIAPPDTQIVYGDTLQGTYYPVLYLLHGYGGDENYFKGLYDVGGVLDEMIANGQIKPMIVVTPNATNNLGGSFYTNSPEIGGRSYAGKMQDFVTEEVIGMVDSLYCTIKDRNHRAVAGHSMGGYGAIKLAMLRNDLFGSAASMSGPLAFWGGYPQDTTFLGLASLMPYVFQENGFNPYDAAVGVDSVVYGDPGSPDSVKYFPSDTTMFYQIKPGTGKRLTNMMFALASAFSPHDPANSDTTFAHRFTTNQFSGRVDLPFGVDGRLAIDSTEAYPIPIWIKWMSNDVSALFMAGYGGVFDSTALYVDAGNQDDLYLQYQAQVFDHIATAASLPHYQYTIYSGFAGFYAADHVTMISERLKDVAKFTNEAFNR
jgi:S-formylglutathione hydrolase FrmB